MILAGSPRLLCINSRYHEDALYKSSLATLYSGPYFDDEVIRAAFIVVDVVGVFSTATSKTYFQWWNQLPVVIDNLIVI